MWSLYILTLYTNCNSCLASVKIRLICIDCKKILNVNNFILVYHATFDWSACTKPGKWAVMYLCIRGTNFAFFYNFLLNFGVHSDFRLDKFGNMILFGVLFISYVPHLTLNCVMCLLPIFQYSKPPQWCNG